MFKSLNMAATRMYFKAQNKLVEFMHKEDGDVNIVSIVVLIGIAVALAIIFRRAIANLINNLFNTIGRNAESAIN